MALPMGSFVAGYRIEGELGSGEAGVVYEATDVQRDRRVALRLLRTDLAEDREFLARLRRDVLVQQSIDHPHIVSIYELGDSEHGPFVAMELVRGPTLKQMIAAGELDLERTMRILGQIAEALDAAHAAGLVHRAVEPQAVLVGPNDLALLTDFGLRPEAQRRGLLSAPRVFAHAPDYLAPEQITSGRTSARSDIYSLGSVLYECLTGEVPYPKGSSIARLVAHVSEPPPRVSERRPDLGGGLDSVLRQALNKKPEGRFARASELIAAAKSALEPSASTEPESGWSAGADATRAPEAPPGGEARSAEGQLFTLLREGARAGVVPELPVAVGGDGGERVESAPEGGAAPASSRPLGRLTSLVGILLPLAALAAAAKWLVGCTIDVEPGNASEDTIDCTVFAPPLASPGESLLVQVFAHRPLQAEDARALATEFDPGTTRRAFKSLETPVRPGSKLAFHLSIPGAQIDEPVQPLIWRGRAESVQFAATAPKRTEPRALIGTVAVLQDSVPVGHVQFKLELRPDAGPQARSLPAGADARRYRSAFLSYASKDRDQVLRGAQLLRSVDIRCFQDILDLDPGDRWERKLYSLIEQSDLFLLFWSKAAKESQWVRKEAEYALGCKPTELDPPEIRPVILERPPSPPWPELAHIHFDDRLTYFIRG